MPTLSDAELRMIAQVVTELATFRPHDAAALRTRRARAGAASLPALL